MFGPLDVQVIVGANEAVVFIKDRDIECSCTGEVLDVGECTMYSDIGTGCSCDTESSGCEVELRLWRGRTELSATESFAVPARRSMSTGVPGFDGTETLEMTGCGAGATIDLPPRLHATAGFTVTSLAGDALLEWTTDVPIDRVHVECGGPFAGHVCSRPAGSPASVPDMLCDPLDVDIYWALRLYDRVQSAEFGIGHVEVWRTTSAEWSPK